MTNDRARSNEPYSEPVADPATNPHPQDLPAVGETPASVPAIREDSPATVDPEPAAESQHTRKDGRADSTRTVAGGTWIALIVGALLLIALLVFILQNQSVAEINILPWTFEIPAGIAYLLCAVVGALIMAMVGGVRMFEYRRKIKKMKKVLS